METVKLWWDNLPIWARCGVLFVVRTPLDRRERFDLKQCAGKEFTSLTGFLQDLVYNFYQANIKEG